MLAWRQRQAYGLADAKRARRLIVSVHERLFGIRRMEVGLGSVDMNRTAHASTLLERVDERA